MLGCCRKGRTLTQTPLFVFLSERQKTARECSRAGVGLGGKVYFVRPPVDAGGELCTGAELCDSGGELCIGGGELCCGGGELCIGGGELCTGAGGGDVRTGASVVLVGGDTRVGAGRSIRVGGGGWVPLTVGDTRVGAVPTGIPPRAPVSSRSRRLPGRTGLFTCGSVRIRSIPLSGLGAAGFPTTTWSGGRRLIGLCPWSGLRGRGAAGAM